MWVDGLVTVTQTRDPDHTDGMKCRLSRNGASGIASLQVYIGLTRVCSICYTI